MKLHKLASMFASTSIALSAFADDHGGDSPDYLSPFNVIGTKADVSELKGSGAVLDSSDLKPFMHTDIHEILRQVPGVYVRGEEGYGFFPNISLRGVDPTRSRKTTIMEDGVPSEPAPYADPSAYYAPTAGRMAGFEILKGTSSLKHGPHNIGGVINYLSTPIPNDQRSYLRASYGENNERISHAFSGGKTDFGGGKLGYLLEVYDHRSDGWQSIPGFLDEPSRDAPIAKTDLLLKLSYEFGDSNYLEFKAGRMDMDADVSYQGVSKEDFLTNPYQRYIGTNQDNMDAEQQRYYLRYTKEFSDTVSLSSTAYYNEFARNWYKLASKYAATDYTETATGSGIWGTTLNTNASGTFNAMKGVAGSNYDGKSNNRVYETKGFQSNLDFEIGSHKFDLGFRYQDDHYYKLDYRQPNYAWVDSDADGATDELKYTPNPKDGGPYQDAQAIEVYLVDDFEIGAFSFSPGVRYTSVDMEYFKNNVLTGSTEVSNALFGIGADYDLSETMTLFGGVHQGQALPNAESATGKGTAANEVIEETSLQFELGLRGSNDSFFYELVYFNTQLEDMVFLASNAGDLTNSLNMGEGSTSGLEVLLGIDIGNESVGVPLSVGATFTDTEYETGTGDSSAAAATEDGYLFGATKGKSFPYIPDTMINLRGGLEFEKFSTYLNYHWQDSVFTNALNDHELDSYGILDWSGFFKINKGVTVFAKVTNVADETYAHSILPGGYRAGMPRSWSVGMEFDF
jgi:Fe(3+) dicitrate transport protein